MNEKEVIVPDDRINPLFDMRSTVYKLTVACQAEDRLCL